MAPFKVVRCDVAHLILRIDEDQMLDTISLKVVDAESGHAVWDDFRHISDERGDLFHMARKFQTSVKDVREQAATASPANQ